VKVAIIGFGTVGSGAARILVEHREEIRRKAGVEIEIAAVCSRNIAKADTSFLPAGVRRVADWREALTTPGVDVVVELVGGTGVAEEVVRAALSAGKTVVTANKNLLAARGSELERLARKSGAGLECEAAVAGGIPVLAALREGLAGERIQALYGILNGTCNYILTTMESAGRDMADVLAEAQQRGYAEADPSADVEGWDARFKLAILARMAFGSDVPQESILCRGITRISAIDFQYAHRLGCTIRLIGAARRGPSGLFCFVRPLLLPATHMLGKVDGAYNAVWVQGAKGGDTMYYGRGAGGDATGVAVVGDIIRAARDLASGAKGRTPPLGFAQPDGAAALAAEGAPSRHYLRFIVRDQPGIIQALAGALAKHRTSIDAVLQEPHGDKSRLPFVITLDPCVESQVSAALEEMKGLPFLCEPPLHLAMEDF
jgi:homoserine dehydrogenase